MTKKLTIELPDKACKVLDTISKKSNCSKGQIIEVALMDYILMNNMPDIRLRLRSKKKKIAEEMARSKTIN